VKDPGIRRCCDTLHDCHVLLFVFTAILLLLLPCVRMCRHLAYVATAVAQLQDTERGSEAAFDEMSDTPTSTPTSTPYNSSGSRAQFDQQQQEQQQAVSELSRALVLELCTAVQQCGSLMDATALANFAAAMGRLGHYDWQTMRHLGTIAKRHTHVGDGKGAPSISG
jgi:hypothetical protein